MIQILQRAFKSLSRGNIMTGFSVNLVNANSSVVLNHPCCHGNNQKLRFHPQNIMCDK